MPALDVLRVAAETGATPYDIPGVAMSHVGELYSFDAFIAKYGLTDPALQQLALIVRGADTSRLDLTPQSAGLHAISLGLSRCFADDHEMLGHGMVMYDALFAWCREGRDGQALDRERHVLDVDGGAGGAHCADGREDALAHIPECGRLDRIES